MSCRRPVVPGRMTRDISTNSTFKDRGCRWQGRGFMGEARALVAADRGIQGINYSVSTLVTSFTVSIIKYYKFITINALRTMTHPDEGTRGRSGYAGPWRVRWGLGQPASARLRRCSSGCPWGLQLLLEFGRRCFVRVCQSIYRFDLRAILTISHGQQ